MTADLSKDTPFDYDNEARRYARLRALFEAALEQPVEARTAWLQVHAEEPELCQAVQRLLDADAAPGQLETPLDEVARRIGDDAALLAQSLIGQHIGGFRLLQTLGLGGMGAVFLGERDNTDFRQLAAIKLLRRGLLSPLEHAMFRRERKALAMLSHPNITHLIDGGVTDSGIPFLVMEYVDGEPITTYVASRKLDLRARLALFLIVCRAAAAAHRRLIVHRDIKPSNILVTATGEVKLLDFGIAKLLDDDDESSHRSQFAAMTRGYAAPEQYVGDPVSTATDVYALGVLLHELLLGERPEQPTQRASSRVPHLATDPAALPASVPALQSALRGDIDNILLKAMAFEPEQRYASAAELADDIERHLHAQPVNAHPPSAWYRTRKFVQRHRGGVLTTVAFALALITSLGVAVWQAKMARDNAATALRQAARAGEIQQFLEALFQPFTEGTGVARAPTLAELLERGAARIGERYPDDAETRAELLALFVRINDNLGATETNLVLARDAWRAFAKAFGDDDVRTLRAREMYARVLRKTGKFEVALREIEAVRATMQEQAIRGQDYARTLDALFAVQRQLGMEPAEGIVLEREALDARLADPEASADDLATGYNNLGGAYSNASDFASATPWYEKALALHRKQRGDSLDTASALTNVASTLTQSGQWRDGEARLLEARDMFRRIGIDQHPALVTVLLRHCGVLVDLELLDRADRVCAEAEAMTLSVHGEHHGQYLGLLLRRANLHFARGERAEAQRDLNQARALTKSDPPIGEPAFLLGVIDAWQARSWWLNDDYPTLRDAMLRLLSTDPANSARLGPGTAGGFYYAGLAALACHHAPDARCGSDRIAQAMRLLAEPAAQNSALRLPAQLALAEIDLANGTPDHAVAILSPLLAELDAELHPEHSLRVQAWLTLAALRAQQGQAEKAQADAARGYAALQALPAGHALHQHKTLLERVPKT
jgi:eukaryotic-like serine/threonine-protein kinase